MTIAAIEPRESADLEAFFSRLHECRNKSEHVHGLHPYPAKFIPHIPRALIGALASEGDVILDPMCGSGTTLVEASVAGHQSVGVDLNPIATLVSRAKTTALSHTARQALRSLAARFEAAATDATTHEDVAEATLPVFHNRDKWFASNVLRELAYAKEAILDLRESEARDFGLCAFSSILVAVSNQESETRWCAKPHDLPDGATLQKLATKLTDGLARAVAFTDIRGASSTVHTGDARHLPVADESVGLVVTSPPYANSHDYYLYNKLRMFWLSHDVADVQRREIGSRNRHSDLKEDISTYTAAMLTVLLECHRVLRPGGTAAIVVADAVIRREFFDMNEIYDELAARAGLDPQASFRFGHRQFNSTFQRGFGTATDKQTHVLVYRAPGG